MSAAWLRQARPYLILCALLAAGFLLLGRLPAQRVGDGSEYYGLYVALDATHRPWMTPEAYVGYDELIASHSVQGLVPKEWFHQSFPQLTVGATWDYNHFWFYSLLALLCAKLAALVGIHLAPQGAFLMLHWFMMSGTAALAWHYYRYAGLLAVALMTIASPLLWFMDKVHTEVMVVCLLTCGMMLAMRRRYVAAALMVALASTQYPHLAMLACVPLLYRIVLQRREPYSFGEVIMGVVTVLAVLAHPVYYFIRYGVVTPQLLAGGAKLGGNLDAFHVWLIDPDLGLLPNWPLGCAVLAVALVLRLRTDAGRPRRDWPLLGFIGAFLLINLYAHSSTTNLNSGATPGLARYALWYMPLLFPAILLIARRSASWRRGGVALLLLSTAVIAVATVRRYDPRQNEQFTVPTVLSYAIQKHAPWLYTPPPEVFMERYSGLGDYSPARVSVGPDCRKVLILPTVQGPVMAPSQCLLDLGKLGALADSLAPSIRFFRFVNLTDVQRRELAAKVQPGRHQFGEGGDARPLLAGGWSQPEQFGIWSAAAAPQLLIPCDSAQYYGGVPFQLVLTLHGYGPQELTVSSHDGQLWQGKVAPEPVDIAITVPPSHCRGGSALLTLKISDPKSPSQTGQSNDTRLLGVGLHSFEIRTDKVATR